MKITLDHKLAHNSPRQFIEEALQAFKSLHKLAETCEDDDMLDCLNVHSRWAELPNKLKTQKSLNAFQGVVGAVSDELLEACSIINDDMLAEIHGRLDIDLGNGNEPVVQTLYDVCVMLEDLLEEYD